MVGHPGGAGELVDVQQMVHTFDVSNDVRKRKQQSKPTTDFG